MFVGPTTATGRAAGRAALITSHATISYGELSRRIATIGASWGSQRRLVLVAASNHEHAVLHYLAAIELGHVVILADAQRPDHIDDLITRYDPDIVVGTAASEVHIRRRASAHILHPDLTLLLSTSGSTGSPKLVRLSRANLVSNADSIATYLGLGPDDRAVTTLPLHYCYGLSVLHSHLRAGGSVVLDERSLVVEDFWADLRRHRVTSLAGVPYTFDLLEATGFEDRDLPSLRRITQAGGRLAPDRVQRWARLADDRDWQFFVMYGQTEATARIAYLPPELARCRPTAIGRAIPGGQLRVEPLSGTDHDGVGELVYTGPNVMMGYAYEAADLARPGEFGELKTGDVGRLATDGLFEVIGRRDRTVKLFGLRLDLDHLERVVAAASADVRLLVVGESLVAAVTSPAEREAAHRALRIQSGLPPFAVRTVLVDEFPTTSSGKPDREALRYLCTEDGPPDLGEEVPQSELSPAATEAELLARVCSLTARILAQPEVGEDDSFVSLGGDSLSYVEASVALEELLGELPQDWASRSLRSLVRARGAVGSRWTRVQTPTILRAAAICLIVATHTELARLPGGAHLLLGVAGWHFARFCLAAGDRPARIRRGLRTVANVALPSVLWLGLVTIFTDTYHVSTPLLVRWLFGSGTWTVDWWVWFIEAFVWMLLILIGFLALPPIDRIERTWPFATALAAVAVGLILRLVQTGWQADGNERYSGSIVFFCFALGWAGARAAGTWQRLLVSALCVLTVVDFLGQWYREGVIIAGLLLLLWVPRIPLPRLLVRPTAALATASLCIFVTHWQIFKLVEDRPWLGFPLSIGFGLLYCWATQQATRAALLRWRRRPPPDGVPSTRLPETAATGNGQP